MTLPPRGPLLASLMTAVLTFALPLAVLALTTASEPEVRLLETRGRISAAVADGKARVVVINSTDREVARAVAGHLYRPWEPAPQLLIAPSDDAAAPGLWELLARTSPQAVAVLGVPGANPLWTAIETACRQRGIALTWVAGEALVELDRVQLRLHAPVPEQPGSRYVEATRGAVRVTVLLDGEPPPGATALVSTRPTHPAGVALVVSANRAARPLVGPEVVIGTREVVRLTLEEQRLRVYGGTYRAPERSESE
jgi:hypothetical protein